LNTAQPAWLRRIRFAASPRRIRLIGWKHYGDAALTVAACAPRKCVEMTGL
jgi:hypothetical protein